MWKLHELVAQPNSSTSSGLRLEVVPGPSRRFVVQNLEDRREGSGAVQCRLSEQYAPDATDFATGMVDRFEPVMPVSVL